MTETIDALGLATLLARSGAGLADHRDRLRELDAIGGDGDMGVTAELVCKAIDKCASSYSGEDIGRLLMSCGMEINKGSPSTFGTLLASAFLESGKVVLGRKSIEVGDLATMGQAAVVGIKKRGKSEVGQKTMLDSLVPAVEAFQRAIVEGSDRRVVLEITVSAARGGLERTSGMKAVHGRAAYREDGGVGSQDAGATAMFHLIESFGNSLLEYLDGQPT